MRRMLMVYYEIVDFEMTKKSHFKPSTRTRESIPHAKAGKDGRIELLCPFCAPKHPISPGIPSVCGTELRVTAVQTIISARTARLEKLTCIKCGKTGKGEMVRYFSGYIHLEDCNPDVQMLTAIPEYSKWAEFVFKLPEWMRAQVEKLTGVVQRVNGLTPEGQETGEVEGYFFNKGAKAVSNG